MTTLNNDQAIRVRCLEICSGSVAEAKNAYYWVMGEPNAAKQQIGASAQQVKREAIAQNAIAAAQGFDQWQQQNALNPHISDAHRRSLDSLTG